MWQDRLKEIIYILENSEVNEIDISFWGRRFRVVKSPSIVTETNPSLVRGIVPEASVAEGDRTPQQINTPQETSNTDKVLSPMPGTFYRASSPDAEPFVKEGDPVKKGDTLCIIEAMKIMNEIESEMSGRIEKILIKDGSPVEYNQPLFVIEPSS